MSRIITKTRTGNIISDEELSLEYLFVGDYGKILLIFSEQMAVQIC